MTTLADGAFKATGPGGVILIQGGGPPWTMIRFFHVGTITPLLITRLFSSIPKMKARDQAVQKRHRNQESPKWLLRFRTIHSDRCSQKGGGVFRLKNIKNQDFCMTLKGVVPDGSVKTADSWQFDVANC